MRAAADGPRSDIISASSTSSNVASSSFAVLTAVVRFSLNLSDVFRNPPNRRSLQVFFGASVAKVFVAAALLSRVPFTPGGLGFVEAGLSSTLVLAGMSTGDAVLATLAYRLVTYWLPIPFGGLAYGIHRWQLHREGVEIESFPELGEQELEHPTEFTPTP